MEVNTPLKRMMRSLVPRRILLLLSRFKLSLESSAGIRHIRAVCIRENSALLLEANYHHEEVLPGLAKYLLDLGYHVDIVVNNRKAKEVFCRFRHNKIRFYVLSRESIGVLLEDDKIKKYRHILISSYHLYYAVEGIAGPAPFEKFYKDFNIFALAPVCMLHDAGHPYSEYLHTNKIISLVPMRLEHCHPALVNAHYFGSIKTHEKSPDETVFISVGGIDKKRKNINMLFDAVKKLLQNNIVNFKVYIAGSWEPSIEKQNIRNVVYLGYTNFGKLFSLLEKSDFMLSLLDHTNEDHVNYNNKASGSYQLCYGFKKPIVIDKFFAGNPGFTEENSLLYKSSEELYAAMERAINMQPEEYKKKVRALENTVSQIYQTSLVNLKNVLERELP